MCIKKGANTLAIVEAVNVRQHFNKKQIHEHCQKLIPYASEHANLFFILLWGFNDDPDRSWQRYIAMITDASNWPPSFSLEGHRERKHRENSADLPMYVTSHGGSEGPHHILHFYVDLVQTKKRETARAARK